MTPPEIQTVKPEDQNSFRELVRTELRAFNREHAGDARRAPVVLAVRDEGATIAGLVGQLAWGWLYVDLLWVDAGHRGRGLGRALLRQAEAAAREHGCIGAVLDTFDFQARPFYEREGYRVFAVLENFPVGHTRFYMEKRWPVDVAPSA